jgi:hypothetical protein
MENSNENIKFGICLECKVREGDSSEKKLYQCPYCKEWFCEKHIEPKLVITWSAIERTKDPILKEKLYEEWRKEDGHPCSVWTMQYFENFEMKEREEREKFLKALDNMKKMKKINLYARSSKKFPKKRMSHKFPSTKRFFKLKFTSESIEGTVVLGLFLSFFSLFLPWLSISLFGLTWINMFQEEILKIQMTNLSNYIITANYILIAILILIVLGFIIVILGLLLTKNSIIFTGSLFLIISALSFLYYLSTSSEISLVSFAGIGFWIFTIGSVLIAYGSAKNVSKVGIFSSLLVAIIVSAIFLSNLGILFITKINELINGYSYPYKDVKSFIENTIRNYLETPSWLLLGSPGTINDLTSDNILLHPAFTGSFDGFTVCATGDYICSYGNEVGENVNYLYCRPYLSPYIFCYKKIITSSTGEIQNVIEGCVYGFVLNPNNLEVVSIQFGPLDEQAKALCQ